MTRRKSFLLRLDPALHEALQRWSAEELRSLNGHIEYLLREAVRRAGRRPSPRGRAQSPAGEAGDRRS
jgi:hypothetical protein